MLNKLEMFFCKKLEIFDFISVTKLSLCNIFDVQKIYKRYKRLSRFSRLLSHGVATKEMLQIFLNSYCENSFVIIVTTRQGI